MTSKYSGLCQRRHYHQAVPEIDAPRRETVGDWAWAFITWGFILGAYYFALAWAVSL